MAGKKSGETLRSGLKTSKPIVPYMFSSLSKDEIAKGYPKKRGDYVLVIGQYADCKGLDVAMDVARRNPDLKFKFVGTGKLTEKFLADMQPIPKNVEVVSFLQKDELKEEYLSCGVMVLPSRQECWGLVVNEAAALGTPIVSTWGAGAAVEYLSEAYPQYLAQPGDVDSLAKAIKKCLSSDNEGYSRFLLEKSREYTLEQMVRCHLDAINKKF